jgi:uncharacterized protein
VASSTLRAFASLTTSSPKENARTATQALLSMIGAASYVGLLWRAGLSESALWTVAAIGVAAVISGIAGFAFSAICGAILFQFRHDSIAVVQTLLVCSTCNQAMCVWLLRHRIKLAPLAPFVVGGLVGVPFGIWILMLLNMERFKLTLGILLAAYGLYMMLRRPVVLARTSLASDVLVGFVGGAIGGFAAIPGAAVSIWCSMKGLDKEGQRAIFQPFILIMQIVALCIIAISRAGAAPVVSIPPLAWISVPAGLIGTFWGMALFKRLRDQQFSQAVNVLLIVSGVGLMA